MNLEQQVRLFKSIPKSNLQEVNPSLQQVSRDPQSVKLENDVNRLMLQKMAEQNKKPDIVQSKNNDVKHVSPDEALKELTALMKSSDNKP